MNEHYYATTLQFVEIQWFENDAVQIAPGFKRNKSQNRIVCEELRTHRGAVRNFGTLTQYPSGYL